MEKDFKALVLHDFELSIAFPRIPKNSPQSRIALVIKLLTKTPKLTMDPHFSRAPPLDQRDSLFICEKLIFGKVGVATYFIYF